jgi:hypothetical protein
MLEHGATIRGVKHLHAKVYLFGDHTALVGSANLTGAAMERNYEAGFVTHNKAALDDCQQSFDQLWKQAGPNLRTEQLDTWDEEIKAARLAGKAAKRSTGLGDMGHALPGATHETPAPSGLEDADQAFIKFWGTSKNRAKQSSPITEEVEHSGCHWSCSYPQKKRPRQHMDGDVIYMARLVKDPADIRIFGRAFAFAHVEGRDEATPADIKHFPWRKRFSNYIRVYNSLFLNSTLGEGVSLGEMMDDLGSDAFASTQRNARLGKGKNTNPRSAYKRHAGVLLSPVGQAWLESRLQNAFDEHGTIPASAIAKFYHPKALPSAKHPIKRR